mgnify:CR=1 FL=1
MFHKFDEAQKFIETQWEGLMGGLRVPIEEMISPQSPFIALKENLFDKTKAITFYLLPPGQQKSYGWWINDEMADALL